MAQDSRHAAPRHTRGQGPQSEATSRPAAGPAGKGEGGPGRGGTAGRRGPARGCGQASAGGGGAAQRGVGTARMGFTAGAWTLGPPATVGGALPGGGCPRHAPPSWPCEARRSAILQAVTYPPSPSARLGGPPGLPGREAMRGVGCSSAGSDIGGRVPTGDAFRTTPLHVEMRRPTRRRCPTSLPSRSRRVGPPRPHGPPVSWTRCGSRTRGQHQARCRSGARCLFLVGPRPFLHRVGHDARGRRCYRSDVCPRSLT